MAKLAKPLGFFGIDNNVHKLKEISSENATKLIRAASLTLTWSHKDIKEAEKEVGGDLDRMYFNFRDILPRKLFKNYKVAIIHQPVELIKWALQFIDR